MNDLGVAALLSLACFSTAACSDPATVAPDASSTDASPDGPTAECTLPVEMGDGPSTSAAWRLETINTVAHPNAVCNDGTPGIYMIRRNPSTTRWIVWLEGGGNCADGASCQQRWNSNSGPSLMSSTSTRNTYTAGTLEFPSSGVFSVDPGENPALHDANMVQIQYCSSDLWSGEHVGDLALPLGDVRRWHFQGRAVALATLDELLAGEGFHDATEVVFGGGSAGAAGTFINIDELRERAPAGARVIGIADGGYQIVYPAYDPVTHTESTETPTPVEWIAVAGHASWGGRGDASCDAAASDEAARVRCRSAEVLTRDGHLATPVLIVNNQYDFNQVNRLGVDMDRDTGDVADAYQASFVHRFAARMRDQLALVDPHHAIFANYDVFHVTVQSDRALTITIDGALERDIVAEWHNDPCAPMRRIEAEIPDEPMY